MITFARLLLLFCLAISPKIVHSVPTSQTTNIHNKHQQQQLQSRTADFVMPYDDDEYAEQETLSSSGKRFKVVRNTNGTLGLVFLPNEQPSLSAVDGQPNNGPDKYSGVRFGGDNNDQDDGPGKSNDDDQHIVSDYDDEHVRTQRDAPQVDSIVFPDGGGGGVRTTPPTTCEHFHAIQCPNNQTFCEDVDDYPVAAIEAIIDREAHMYAGLFDKGLPNDLATRIDDSDEMGEMSMCDSTVQTIQPKSALNVEGTYSIIVNSDKYKQSIQIEQCLSVDKPCNYAKNFASNLRTQCRQFYRHSKMLAFADDNQDKPQMIEFKFPSCCQCRVISHG